MHRERFQTVWLVMLTLQNFMSTLWRIVVIVHLCKMASETKFSKILYRVKCKMYRHWCFAVVHVKLHEISPELRRADVSWLIIHVYTWLVSVCLCVCDRDVVAHCAKASDSQWQWLMLIQGVYNFWQYWWYIMMDDCLAAVQLLSQNG